MIAVGVDVAEARKGLDLVALDSGRQVVLSRGGLTVDQVAGVVLQELGPDIVCVDSPSGWSRSGKSRRAERELARLRISAFATGPDPGDHSFYRWMRVGFSIFDAVANRYPLFRGRLPGIDRIDAALAALTGLIALEGTWSCVGDPDEGVVLLPPLGVEAG